MKRALAPLVVACFLASAPAAGQEDAGDLGRATGPDPSLATAVDADPRGIAPPGVTIQRLDLTGTPVVEGRMTVVDAAGDWVHGLRADEFEVRLDDRPIELGTGRARLASRFVDGEHLTVLVVVDVSGSMRDALPHVRAAIVDFSARLGEKDEIGLVTVADASRAPIPPGADRERLVAILDSLPIGGNTAILDAIVAGLDSLAASPAPRRALIVLSDGVDNRSVATVEEAAAAAHDRGIPIYGVALGVDADTVAMAALADASGGRLLREGDPAELRRVYSDLAELLESEYRLTLRLADDEVGRWHRLEVTLRSPTSGVPEAAVSAERPFLASRTPGVDRGFVTGARAEHARDRLLWWWALGSLAALVPTLGIALVASRNRRIAPLALALIVALALSLGGVGALLWRALAP